MFSSRHFDEEHGRRPDNASPGHCESTRADCGDGDPWATINQPRSTPVRTTAITANTWTAASVLVALRDPSDRRPPSSVRSANPFVDADHRTPCPLPGMTGTLHRPTDDPATRPVYSIAGRVPLPGASPRHDIPACTRLSDRHHTRDWGRPLPGDGGYRRTDRRSISRRATATFCSHDRTATAE